MHGKGMAAQLATEARRGNMSINFQEVWSGALSKPKSTLNHPITTVLLVCMARAWLHSWQLKCAPSRPDSHSLRSKSGKEIQAGRSTCTMLL